jgi:hypothetical protein
MIDILHGQYVIKLKQFAQLEGEWLATVRSLENKTIASNWLDTQSQAEDWARNLIDNLLEEE